MKPIGCLSVIIGLSIAPLTAQAQASSTPPAAEVSEAGANVDSPASPPPERALALGFTLDLLPIVLSATAGDFGMSGQVWMGIDHLRLRLVGAKISQPDWLAAKDGFRDQDTAVMAFIFDYVFGKRFDEWWVGTGFELWQNSIGREDAPGERASWTNVV